MVLFNINDYQGLFRKEVRSNFPRASIDHISERYSGRKLSERIPFYEVKRYINKILKGDDDDDLSSRMESSEDGSNSEETDDVSRKESDDKDSAKISALDTQVNNFYERTKFTFAPKTRRKRWPGVELPKQGTRRLNKNQTLRHRILTIWNVAYAIRKKIEEIEIAEADVDIEPEPYKEEPETEEEEENLAHELRKMKNLWWKMGRDEDLPVDVQLADRYVRASPKLSENSPVHIQREMQQCKEFQDYLDNHGVSELIIGILMMLYTKPCYPEGAKELLRLGLGGKPTEVATAADVLKEIEEAQDRISDLEGELYDYRVQVLRLLKEDAYDEPDDPTVSKTPIRRMEYLLKAFQCRSRPSDVDFNMLYDLSELPGLAKYKIKLPKELDALGRGLAVGSSMGKAEIGVNTKKWILGPPMDHSTELH
ncbi:uncharacterized protein LOC106666415 isoform X2 [Cimex lectularius]|uniref:Uncharacterized protein n=1 Tax=Cimex lectularius TaxID=79782 RepID=A0A8I6RSA2_CIMLE|nr:uncharacterized protein LOC106666415 isoform X2 [Cimex lectularius]